MFNRKGLLYAACVRIEPSDRIMAKLGERIRRLREEKGLRQEDFEDTSPISVTARGLQKIEYGVGNPRLYTLYKIASRLGVKVKDLVDF